MKDFYPELIRLFAAEAKKIPGIYDALLRGSVTSCLHDQKAFIRNWSDLDFSIIVKEITPEVRKDVRDIYRKLREKAEIKITITLVDKQDFFSCYHCHGIRPLYYSHLLYKAKSLLKEDIGYAQKDFHFDNVAIMNCFSNISYLVHDLRKSHMECGDSLSELSFFCRHLVKRTKHIIRNAIFMKTGHMDEAICDALLIKNFPDVDSGISKRIGFVRSNWEEIRADISKMHETIDYMFKNLEIIYSSMVGFVK